MTFDRSKPYGVVCGGEFSGCFDQGGNLFYPDGRLASGSKEKVSPKLERKPRTPKTADAPADAQLDAQLSG